MEKFLQENATPAKKEAEKEAPSHDKAEL